MPNWFSAFLNAWIDGLAGAVSATSDRLAGRDRPLFASLDGADWVLFDAERQLLGRLASATASSTELNRQMHGRRIVVTMPEGRLFRAELPLAPAESLEFLPAIVEHRVDRIAPWRRDDRLTGFVAQSDESGQIGVSIAVTARVFVAPLIDAAETAGARSLSIDAATGSGRDGELEIEISLPSSRLRKSRLRRRIGLAIGLFAALAGAWAVTLSLKTYDLSRQSAELQERIDQRLTVLREAASAQSMVNSIDPIDGSKQTAPVAVVVLEALSRLLPDDTWLSSLRLQDNSVRIAGRTGSLSRLVPLLIQSPYFKDATFAEPTERQEDGSDRFSIELVIRPTRHMEAP